ncbi:ribonuclease H-like protein [Mycena leptocephala]|nr:ribonuclease H-like protein [Mycena leptocephala]
MTKLKLDSLIPKWDPRTPPLELPAPLAEDTEDLITFVGPPPIRRLTEGFRIFTKSKPEPEPAVIPPVERIRCPDERATKNSGQDDAQAGAGVWFSEYNTQSRSLHLPLTLNQNKAGAEAVAALHRVKQVSNDTKLHLEGGHRHILNAMSKNVAKWEDKGWVGVPNREPIKALLANLRERTETTTLAVVKGSGSVDSAANLARDGSVKELCDIIDLRIQPDFQLSAIKELRETVHRKSTDENIRATQEAVKLLYKKKPTAAAIWKSIRNQDISHQIKNFLWKTIHGAHRIRKFWSNIPDMEDRANCQHCGVLETMEHILLQCTRPGQAEIWKLAEELWLMKDDTWPALSMGTLLGCGLANFKGENGKNSPATARLYRILITESLYLIWKLCCECIISRDGEAPSENEIHNRWVSQINERLSID